MTPVHRIGSPQVRASPKNLHTPTGKTANVSGKKQSEGTSVAANTPVRSGPPSTKVSAEKQTPGRRKSSLNKPAANKNTPVNEMLPGSGKRKAEVVSIMLIMVKIKVRKINGVFSCHQQRSKMLSIVNVQKIHPPKFLTKCHANMSTLFAIHSNCFTKQTHKKAKFRSKHME